MKKLNNADLQDRFDSAKYASYSVKDGKKRAKIGLEIWQQLNDKEWGLVSDSGIKAESFNAIRLRKGGKIG